jgi:hypothetical protein
MRGSLVLHFTRISPTHHRFEYVREDGTTETKELETRSCLFHDLLHFAVETEACLARSFHGLLLRGHSFAELMAKDPLRGAAVDHGEIGMTERVVGALTNVVRRNGDPRAFLAIMNNMAESCGESLPSWLTEGLVVRVKERMRKLAGEWNATPFGKTLELRFVLSSERRQTDGASS